MIDTYKKTSHAKSADDGQGWTETNVNDTLNAFDQGETRTPTLIRQVFDNHREDVRYNEIIGASPTVTSRYGTGGGNTPLVKEIRMEQNTVVRRLTPLECERLQGYPDGWTDIGEWTDSQGKKHKDSDSPRYKALGNSIALPFWAWMAKRMAEYLPEGATMASLFDGIGGFPLVYQACGVRPVWASEIEEFPIAVTKIRFPEPTEGE